MIERSMHRRRRRGWGSTAMMLSTVLTTTQSSHGFVPPYNHHAATVRSSSSTLHQTQHRPLGVTTSSLSATSTVTTGNGVEQPWTAQGLSARTVKELRAMVQASPTTERGTLSKLTRKQDYVEYLLQHPPGQVATVSVSVSLAEAEAQQQSSMQTPPPLKQQHQQRPLSMPPSRESARHTTTHPRSPKDAIFADVHARYPNVTSVNENTHLGDSNADGSIEVESSSYTDVRQSHHPMLLATPHANADLEVVCVGTASCTPGLTRGVSCTALRLHWNRRGLAFGSAQSATGTGTAQGSSSSDSGSGSSSTNVFQGGTWLFDVGECTQLQIQKTNSIKPSKITKIFVTHAHGDHSFGLPGLLCLMGQDRGNSPPVEIYGPEGLRTWLRCAIRYSVSRIVPPYVVHELVHVPMAPGWEWNAKNRRYFYRMPASTNGHRHNNHHQQQHGNRQRQPQNHSRRPTQSWKPKGLAGEDPSSWISQAPTLNLERCPLYSELEGGRQIYPDYQHPQSHNGAPVWDVLDESDVKVYAAPMSHGIPCVGYVVHEQPRPGRLRNEVVQPVVERNFKALQAEGFRAPFKAMAVIKHLEPGSAFTFPDGTVIRQEDAVEPARRGRKIVLCGDTSDASALTKLAQDADVLIHEATNAYLTGVDTNTNLAQVTRDAVVHGHSTPAMAGAFCKRVGAKRLLLNHFSARYKGDVSVDSLSIMMRIEQQAMAASGLNVTNVAAAWDFMSLPVAQH